jgi:hypothetical protein
MASSRSPVRPPESPLTGAERGFTFVYFDTEPLRAGAWPILRSAAVTLTSLVQEVGLTLCLPEPVEAELNAQFMRDFTEIDGEILRAWTALERLFRRANASPSGTPHRPAEAEARQAYDRAVDTAIATHQLTRSSRSLRELDEYFQLALNQTPPFNKGGGGFKDALILLSVIDDLLGRGASAGLLVTRDGDFKEAEALAARLGATLLVRNTDAAIELLKRRLDAVARASYAAGEGQALALAESELPQLADFIRANLEVPSSVLAQPAEELLSFAAIDIVSVEAVQSDPAFSILTVGQSARLTFRLRISLIAEVAPIPETLRPATNVRVGDTLTTEPPSARDQLVELLVAQEVRSSGRHRKDVTKNVELDAEATKTEDGFGSLAPIAVRLTEMSLIQELAAMMSRRGPQRLS